MKYNLPDENTPGFLRRDMKRRAFLAAAGEEKVDAMVDWLSEYIEDEDKEQAILDASEAEINELIAKITGVELPDPKGRESTESG